MNGAERAVPATRAAGGVRRTALAAVGGLVLAVVLFGGYSHRWPWTGINGADATLWDWLHLLLLPLALAVLPVWWRDDTRLHPRTKAVATTVLAVLAIVVLLGYAVPWAWTGFVGNTLWDWINLVLLPVTLLTIPRLLKLRAGWRTRHSLMAVAVAVVFGVLVVGGYLGSWGWTGFTGNTLWNWLNLLVLPLLVPTVIVPALTPIATGHIVYLDAEGNPIPDPGAAVAQSQAPVATEPVGPDREAAGAPTVAGG